MIIADEDRIALSEQIANALRDLRKMVNASQIEVVLNSGISYSHLSKIESCVRLPSLATLHHIAKGYDCELVITFRKKKSYDVPDSTL